MGQLHGRFGVRELGQLGRVGWGAGILALRPEVVGASYAWWVAQPKTVERTGNIGTCLLTKNRTFLAHDQWNH